jgi:hypothetical protein
MVHMSNGQFDLEQTLQTNHNVQQNGTIQSTGNGQKNTVFSRTQALVANPAQGGLHDFFLA